MVRAGGVTIATGRGFPPNTPITMTWEGIGVVGKVVTDAVGAFDLPILMLSSERIGGRTLIVSNPTSFPRLRVPFLVQLTTAQARSGNLQVAR